MALATNAEKSLVLTLASYTEANGRKGLIVREKGEQAFTL